MCPDRFRAFVLRQIEEIARDQNHRKEGEEIKHLHPHQLSESMMRDDSDAA
jgi:hypothetical protein